MFWNNILNIIRGYRILWTFWEYQILLFGMKGYQKSPCWNKEKWFIQSHTTVGSYGILDFWDGRLHGQSKS